MRIIESRSIDNQAGLLGSRLITGTNVIEGAFQSFIVAEDTVVTKVYNSIGIDVTGRLGLTSITLKAGAFISMPKGDYFSSIKLASGSIVAYFTSHGGMSISADAYLNEFLSRTGSSYLEASECVKAHLQQLINAGLLQKASLIMSPSMYEEDLVKSVVPQDASGDLSFTRASNGTRVNSAGLVEVCPWNLLQQSNTFNTTWAPLSGASVTGGQAGYDGTNNAWLLSKSAVGGFIYQSANSYNGQYTISVYAKANTLNYIRLNGNADTDSEGIFNLSNGTINYQLNCVAEITSVGGGWYRCSITSSDVILDYVNIYPAPQSASSGSIYIQNAQLNIGALKPYFPTTDRLNVPRLTYQNGGGGCPSLLLEKQSTNLCLYSEQFDNAAWTKTSGTVTANQAISPDGTQNADKCVGNNGVVTMDMRTASAFSITSGSVYTWSLYVKKAGYRYCQMTAWTADDPITIYDLDNGVVVSELGPSHTSTITSVGNGWYRITITRTASNSIGWLRFSPLADSTASSAQNGTDGFYIWGAQVEASSYVTSYIVSTSSSATRVADACFKTGISSLIGQSEGFIAGEVEGLTNSYGSQSTIMSVSDGTTQNRVMFSFNATTGYVTPRIFKAGSTIFVNDFAITLTQKIKFAIGWGGGRAVCYVNGTQVQETTGLTFFSSGTLTRLGADDGAGSNIGIGKVGEYILGTTNLTNAQLQSLTL